MDISILWKALIVTSALVVGLGSTYVYKMKEDNAVEEIAEQVIKEQIDLDIDITPKSKEE